MIFPRAKTCLIQIYLIVNLVLISACGGSSGNSNNTNNEPQSAAQAVTHALLNGTWETGCLIDANDENSSFTLSHVYLDGTLNSNKTNYSDNLCTIISLMESVSASYTLGNDISLDVSIADIPVATQIDYESTDIGLPFPFFDLVAIKNGAISELYTGNISQLQTDGSSNEKRPNQLQATASAIKHDRLAEVVSVDFSGSEFNYTFNVGVLSQDTGCNQYADWWEVISPEGGLIYRRILVHSHIDEQPFVRPGTPVPIADDQIVIVRAHLNAHALVNSGYGTQVFRGSIVDGFTAVETEQSFATDLVNVSPLPSGCAF
ncbi:hypothetical protein MNBD_GAMMA13-1072 [hydrothermal vent metagenome]|uniref:Lipoprotein n=1 Tax=hydrothermal vent metagenome TaxID=652676 RepID=A0A3B0YRY9_9ZZZZ